MLWEILAVRSLFCGGSPLNILLESTRLWAIFLHSLSFVCVMCSACSYCNTLTLCFAAGEWECMLHSRTSRCTSSCKRSKVKALPPPVAADDTTTSLVTPKTATHESPIDGLPVYSGPRRKEYIMADARVKSYKDWPSKVKQSPQALANAGFFYCGKSRCHPESDSIIFTLIEKLTL